MNAVAPGESTTFTVTFSASAPGLRSAALQVASNDADENPFDIALRGLVSAEQGFTSTNGIAIPNSGTAAPYPSIIEVSGVTGAVTALRVKLNAVTHTYGDDIDAFLVAPDGQVCALMSDAGGGSSLSAIDLVFDDLAATKIPDSSPIATGSYRPANWSPGEALPPGGVGTIGTNLLNLATAGVNGQWKLFITDDAGGDSGSIVSWAIVIEVSGPEITVEQPPGVPLTDSVSTVTFSPAAVGTSISRTFTVRNQGNANLSGLLVTKDGAHQSKFALGALGATDLAPGAGTTFLVTLTAAGNGE